jgi:spore coat protein U-like protein
MLIERRALPLVYPLILLALCGASRPQTTTTNMSPSATVVAKCTITSFAPLAFGNYDPVVINRSSPLDNGANSLMIACTRGAPGVSVSLDDGQNFSSPYRRMLAGGMPDTYLNYNIYTTSGYSTVWNAINTVPYASDTKAASLLVMYGSIPGGQDATVNASYSDMVVATVTF